MRSFFLVFLFFSGINLSVAQQISWSKSHPPITRDHHIVFSGMIEISANEYLIAGYCDSILDYDMDTSTAPILPAGTASYGFITSIDSTGKVFKNRVFRSSNSESVGVLALKRDKKGNIYVFGYLSEKSDSLISFDSAYARPKREKAVYFAKYNPSFEFQWVRFISDTLNFSKSFGLGNMSIDLDESGNSYIYALSASSIDIDPGEKEHFLNGEGEYPRFVASFDSRGQLRWVKEFSPGVPNPGSTIKVANNSVYIMGNFLGKVDFQPGPGEKIVSSTSPLGNTEDCFISKFSAKEGSFIDVTIIRGKSRQYIHEFEVDDSGNIYATGGFAGKTEFDSLGVIISRESRLENGAELTLVKYGPDLNLKWIRNIGSAGWDYGFLSICDDQVYWGSKFYGGFIEVDHSTIGVQKLRGVGKYEERKAFLVSYDTSGVLRWGRTFGSKKGETRINSLFAFKHGIFLAGEYLDTLIFNNGQFSYAFDTAYKSGHFHVKFVDRPVMMASKKWIFCDGDEFTFPDGTKTTESAKRHFPYIADDGRDSISSISAEKRVVNSDFEIFNDSLVAEVHGLKYEWIDCSTGKITSIQDTLVYFIASRKGDYALVAKDGLCSDTSDCQTVTSVGIDKDGSTIFSVFPNPTQKQIRISANLISEDRISISLVGLDGTERAVLLQPKTISQGFFETTVHLPVDISPGVYFVRLSGNNTLRTEHLIVR